MKSPPIYCIASRVVVLLLCPAGQASPQLEHSSLLELNHEFTARWQSRLALLQGQAGRLGTCLQHLSLLGALL
jgi:hypothetical protein